MNLFPPTNTPSPAQVNAALLILRIASALAFLYHGSAILFGAFGGPGPQKFAAFLHLPVVIGYLVGLGQFLPELCWFFTLSANASRRLRLESGRKSGWQTRAGASVPILLYRRNKDHECH
jgi:hypothetical protein